MNILWERKKKIASIKQEQKNIKKEITENKEKFLEIRKKSQLEKNLSKNVFKNLNNLSKVRYCIYEAKTILGKKETL